MHINRISKPVWLPLGAALMFAFGTVFDHRCSR